MSFSEQIKLMQEQMQGFDINDLDPNTVGTWPLPVKLITWLLAFGAIIFLGHLLLISDLKTQRDAVQQQEAGLRTEFETKAHQAAHLEDYRKQMVEMKESFGALVSQLPSETDVPGLLEDITNKGAISGLVFTSIDLQPEVSKEFYIEVPIKIVATGTYHDMGAFVSGVASLPRIVTLTDFSIKPKDSAGKDKDGRDNSNLEIEITASTYRYKGEADAAKKDDVASARKT